MTLTIKDSRCRWDTWLSGSQLGHSEQEGGTSSYKIETGFTTIGYYLPHCDDGGNC
jgi:hypothetical protein